ncbi:MAG: Asp-tRNA(Asn)/Glu-tRNA(Gln) amidotransferase subunit GatB [Candidatus Shapirobacteria bacterium]|nr:Asp-tRNA(Asn)/Glu-tRNA(Gln) amidotransferase subunit GatB [Candidatus Shapirobacteria bacterium]MDD5073719.1 Asp-tRNA(Asn)/Glu-tRNA(Gln) amidotransferase subunit GatB [Candidatus Shapirobacteria bacterium]MDD5481708.1 Asp-tRNA(Asn)/Glu-tRNA(Gln) amidotransferase subunit GatB [Candidatus Shapirobacteria bacterium]
MMKQKFFPIIGLEIHIELTTKRKMFCDCPADHFNKEPNTQTCPVCLGLPGALPVPNKEAIKRTLLLAISLDCQINSKTWFDRKNYFYPDLPKGYQISQFFRPMGIGGQVNLETGQKINIKEVHLEEDTAKSLIKNDQRLLDFNKSGVPLIEVVSCPDLTSPQEAKDYAQKIHQLVRTLKISSADMEKGQMRLEANISLKKSPQDPLPNYKVEIKNINSFRYLHDAITYEINRQSQLLSAGKKITQETRGYNPRQKTTFSQRSKEEAYEYRYFPEPDIPPLNLTRLFQLDKIRASLPELPEITIKRLISQYHLSRYQADILFRKYPKRGEAVLKIAQLEKIKTSDAANAIINQDYPLKNLTPREFVNKIKSTQESTLLISGNDLETIINQVIAKNPKAVNDYRAGKEAALGFLIGQTQQKTKGKTDVANAKQIFIKILNRG